LRGHGRPRQGAGGDRALPEGLPGQPVEAGAAAGPAREGGQALQPMKWLALLLVCPLVSMQALGQGLPGSERVEFGGIFGYFVRASGSGKAPAIVMVHGSGGVTAAREGFWATELSQVGIAALVTDSFT